MLIVRDLGRQPYEQTWQAMRERTDHCSDEASDELWLLEHDPVFTLGQGGKLEHLLISSNVPVVRSDRGGQITYHGPGQLIAYLLVNLKRNKLGVRDLVTLLEQGIIKTLAYFNISAQTKLNAPGVYVAEAKIASVGLRIRRGFSYHGLALNVAGDLSPFEQINPCGHEGLKMVRIKDFLPSVTLAEVKTVLSTHLQSLLIGS